MRVLLTSTFALLLSVIIVIGMGAAGQPQAAQAAGEIAAAEVRGFDLLTADDGWLWQGRQLFATRDGGAQWNEITPPDAKAEALQSVFFVDAAHGWVVSSRAGADGLAALTLDRTSDGGQTWQSATPVLFEAGDPDAVISSVSLFFLDTQTGWLATKRATGNSFSLGALFGTRDGGQTWTRLTLPLGEPVYFATPDIGWTAGGPAGDQLFRTIDGGRSWAAQTLAESLGARRTIHLPHFDNEREGILPVVVGTASGTRVDAYTSMDGGATWRLALTTPVQSSGTHVAVSLLGAGRWLMAGTGGPLLSITNGRDVTRIASTAPSASSFVALDMATAAAGWAQSAAGNCTKAANGTRTCTQATQLLRTQDGGRTWLALALPASATTQRPAETQLVAGQGLDACYHGSVDEMQTWFASSPYSATNLYIGGAALFHGCIHLTPQYVSQLSQQGWTFIPTWVGLQAPCFAITSTPRFSYDLATAYAQGLSEADAALEAAAGLGLTAADWRGTIIYYDMEYFPTNNTPCRDAAKAFVDGWSGRLRARGDMAGVYAVSSVMSDYALLSHAPDNVWLAQWNRPYGYTTTASVYNVPGIDNSLWSNHQRLHQYTGGHDETWGGVTLNIDSDVLDGSLATLPCVAFGVAVTPNIGGTAAAQTAPNCAGGYTPQSAIQLLITPANGYLFTGWRGAASGLSNPLTVTIDTTSTVTATFGVIASQVYVPVVMQ